MLLFLKLTQKCFFGGVTEPPKSRFCACHIERSLYTCAVNHIPRASRGEITVQYSIIFMIIQYNIQPYNHTTITYIANRNANNRTRIAKKETKHVCPGSTTTLDNTERRKSGCTNRNEATYITDRSRGRKKARICSPSHKKSY